MQTYLNENNLVDLISDKHAKLRKKVIEAWVQNGEEKITDTESYMIAIIHKESTTVAQIAKKIGMSRQGAHKCAKVLMERGYIKIENHHFMDETLHIKRNLEEEIIKSIGREKFDMMKEIFSSSWFK